MNSFHNRAKQQDAGQTDIHDIGEEQVKAIVLAKVPGATTSDIYEFEREYDDGRKEYDIEIIYDGYEYDFEISAETGEIISKDVEREND